jgi:hypothetical protein
MRTPLTMPAPYPAAEITRRTMSRRPQGNHASGATRSQRGDDHGATTIGGSLPHLLRTRRAQRTAGEPMRGRRRDRRRPSRARGGQTVTARERMGCRRDSSASTRLMDRSSQAGSVVGWTLRAWGTSSPTVAEPPLPSPSTQARRSPSRHQQAEAAPPPRARRRGRDGRGERPPAPRRRARAFR